MVMNCNGDVEPKVIYHNETIKMELMTPEKAMRLLKRNNNNRKICRKNVIKYKNAILKGNYIATGDCITVDIYGNLLNGQHRLTAIAEANVPVKVDIKYGCNPDVKYIQNTGKATSLTDKGEIFLKNLGIHSKMYPVICKTIDYFENKGKFSKSKLEYHPQDVVDFATDAKNNEILKKVSKHAAQRHNIFGNASLALTKEVIFNLIDEYQATIFFDKIYENSFLKGEPAHALWKWLENRKKNNLSRWASGGEEELNLALNIAWNAFIENKTITKINLYKDGVLRDVTPHDVYGQLEKYCNDYAKTE